MRTKIVISLCVLVFSFSCKSPTAPQSHDFKIVGKVFDGNSGIGIAGASVYLRERSVEELKAHTFTDENGRYMLNFRIIYSSNFQLKAFKKGYIAEFDAGRDTEYFEDTEKTQTANFSLYQLSTVSWSESDNH